MSIPVRTLVTINPGVVSAGGAAVALNGLILTNNAAVPIGAVIPFPSLASVQSFFGPSSQEATLAAIYFSGPDNSTAKPGALLFSQYPATAVAGYMRGAALTGITLDTLKTLSGVLTVSVDGASKTSSAISLSAATSFSSAAAIIQGAFNSLGATVSYDSVRNAFVFTSSTTGAASSVSYATGTLSAGLRLGQADGATLSPGAAAATPATFMPSVVAASRNWASFMTTFEAPVADELAFATWVNSTNSRFVYVEWDTDLTATVAGNTTAFGSQLTAAKYSGTIPVWGSGSVAHAAFVMGVAASIDFNRTNSRITFAFKTQSGLAPAVTDETSAANLIANGYNYFGQYASSNATYNIFYPGSISGPYKFADEYYNQVWLNSAFEAALINLLVNIPSIPYNDQGYGLIEAAMLDPITAALNAGVIRENVSLSSAQKAQVNSQAGTQIDTVLSTRGWYLQIQDATAIVRASRGSPPMTFWYMDGGAIQQITLASLVVQ